MTTRVVVADDHPLLLEALAALLRGSGGFDVVEATSSGHRALKLVGTLQPDIAVLDVSMPDIGGMDILRAAAGNRWPVKIVFLSATMTGKQIAEAMELGVRGIMLKESATDDLLHCLVRVAGGHTWIPEELVARAEQDNSKDTASLIDALTRREREIAELVCQGLSNRAIAGQLGSAEGTVSIHLHNIYRKLSISSRTSLAALLVQHQILTRPGG